MVCSLLLKNLIKLNMWRTKLEVVGPKTLSTGDEQNLKMMSFRNGNQSSKDLTQDLINASEPSADPSTEEFPRNGGRQEAILNLLKFLQF